MTKADSYEKDQLIHYKKQNDYEVYSLSNQEDNFQKKTTIDIIFYLIDLLIMKIRGTHIFMDHHSKQIRIENLIFITVFFDILDGVFLVPIYDLLEEVVPDYTLGKTKIMDMKKLRI